MVVTRSGKQTHAGRKIDLKRSKGEYSEDYKAYDRLGNLPEDILGHILSLLPTTEEAVQTSILSSKWRFKWTLITCVSFDDDRAFSVGGRGIVSKERMFENFVERVLLHLGNSKIQSFTLNLSWLGYDMNQIHEWILSAMRLDARSMDIYFPFVDPPEILEFPCLTNCSATLESLLVMGQCHIKVMPSISFSRLRDMSLDRVFMDMSLNSSEDIHEYFDISFDVLERLSLRNCRWKSVRPSLPTLKIKAPKLSKFSIEDNDEREVFNVDEYYTCECVLMMSVPQLTKFEVDVYSVPDVTLEGTSSIVDLSILAHPYQNSDWDREGEKFVKLLQVFSNVKNLKVATGIISKHCLLELKKLIHLELTSGKFNEYLMMLLRCAPVLESLIFSSCFKHNKTANLEEMVPQCVLSHLKEVVFDNYNKGFEDSGGLKLAQYLLKNGMVLEKMIIKSNLFSAIKEFDKLLQYPRCSSYASVLFEKWEPFRLLMINESDSEID